MSIGERITTLRKQKEMSQGELAKALSISRQAVSKWESDQSSPDTLNLIKLSDLLDTQVEFLATGRHTPKTTRTPPPVYVNLIQNEDKIQERIIEKPVIKRVVRIRYRQNPLTLAITAILCFAAGLAIGILVF